MDMYGQREARETMGIRHPHHVLAISHFGVITRLQVVDFHNIIHGVPGIIQHSRWKREEVTLLPGDSHP
jgi:hypothetical protein